MAARRPQKRERLDRLLVQRGLAESRERAQGLIMAGRVRAGGQVVDKPGFLLSPETAVAVEPGPPYVSRGGIKLAHALEHFRLEVIGWVTLDVGASTGGFTDCLLQRDAARVYALDVGRGQLHQRLQQEPRVVAMERVNAHFPFHLPEPVHLATVDVSFISLTKVVPNVAPHLLRDGRLLCLVKPQFEAGPGQVPRGGVVRDPRVHGAVLAQTVLWAVDQGLRVRGVTPSPIEGEKGNREFFVLLQKE